MVAQPLSTAPKPPRPIFATVFAFAPNRDTMGGTAYFIKGGAPTGVASDSPILPDNILIDAPAWDQTTENFLVAQGGVRWLFITHRSALGKAATLQKRLGCELVIQEQEAYLLPETPKTTFQHNFRFGPQAEALWTPGYSPGSACLYYRAYGGVLFTGRHLLPNREGQPEPLRFSKTFHWLRQLEQIDALKARFTSETLAHLCPAANTGFLRGQRTIDKAYARLQQLDTQTYRNQLPLL